MLIVHCGLARRIGRGLGLWWPITTSIPWWNAPTKVYAIELLASACASRVMKALPVPALCAPKTVMAAVPAGRSNTWPLRLVGRTPLLGTLSSMSDACVTQVTEGCRVIYRSARRDRIPCKHGETKPDAIARGGVYATTPMEYVTAFRVFWGLDARKYQ